MKETKILTESDIAVIAQAAQEEARKNNWKVTIAITDAGGHILWMQRMDGAPVMGSIVAAEKARASALTGRPSKALEDMVNNGRFAALSMPISPLEGAEPIIVDGNVIGAIGVSGGAAPDAAKTAQAGLAALAVTV